MQSRLSSWVGARSKSCTSDVAVGARNQTHEPLACRALHRACCGFDGEAPSPMGYYRMEWLIVVSIALTLLSWRSIMATVAEVTAKLTELKDQVVKVRIEQKKKFDDLKEQIDNLPIEVPQAVTDALAALEAEIDTSDADVEDGTVPDEPLENPNP